MEVIRKCKKEVKKVQLGDQIVLGRYTATAVAQDESGTTFCFDQVYGESPTATPFDEKRAKTLYKSKAMDSVRDKLVPFYDDVANVSPAKQPLIFFRSPTAEEVFSKQKLRAVEPAIYPGANTRWGAMKMGQYRIGFDVEGGIHSYWTDSLVNKESKIYETEGTNVHVDIHGQINYQDVDKSSYIFWRPVFKLKV